MDKRGLEFVLGAELASHGFNRKSSSWYREAEGGLQVVDLQKSSYGLQFYLNLCCVPAGMAVEGMPTPKEHKCPIRIRLTAAFQEHRDDIEAAFDLDRTSLSEAQRQGSVVRIVREWLLPFFDQIVCARELRRAIEQGVFKRGVVSLEAQRHLGLIEQATSSNPEKGAPGNANGAVQ